MIAWFNLLLGLTSLWRSFEKHLQSFLNSLCVAEAIVLSFEIWTHKSFCDSHSFKLVQSCCRFHKSTSNTPQFIFCNPRALMHGCSTYDKKHLMLQPWMARLTIKQLKTGLNLPTVISKRGLVDYVITMGEAANVGKK